MKHILQISGPQFQRNPSILKPNATIINAGNCFSIVLFAYAAVAYIYTEPVQKGPCVIFHHPTAHELEKVNRANNEFNKGVEVGPSGNK
jgi:hypothetical protein